VATLAPANAPEAPADAADPFRPVRWTRHQYHRLIETGVLAEGSRGELIEGVIYEMPPMLAPHAAAVGFGQDVLTGIFGERYHVRVQLPLALGEASEPEPDLAVVAGSRRDFITDHPTSAELVVEVADTTLRADRRQKGSLYARFALRDYWIVNLNARVIEVYRDPAPDPTAPHAFSYRTRIVVPATDSIAPLAAPDRPVPAADLLP
jgi:Uma2 family endonuclease